MKHVREFSWLLENSAPSTLRLLSKLVCFIIGWIEEGVWLFLDILDYFLGCFCVCDAFAKKFKVSFQSFLLCGDLFQLCFRHFDKLFEAVRGRRRRSRGGMIIDLFDDTSIRLVCFLPADLPQQTPITPPYFFFPLHLSPLTHSISVAPTSFLLALLKCTSRTCTSCFSSLSCFLLSVRVRQRRVEIWEGRAGVYVTLRDRRKQLLPAYRLLVSVTYFLPTYTTTLFFLF